MKQLLYAISVLIVLAGILHWTTRVLPERPSPLAATPASPAAENQPNPTPAVAEEPPSSAQLPAPAPATSQPVPVHPRVATQPSANQLLDLNQEVAALTDSQTPHVRKEALWKQLTDAGKLDEAIAVLERRVAENPNSPRDLATLGHAYLQKAGTTQDYKERASLGMKIDQTFDQALKLDPADWEARFNKTVSMSYWPEFLGKAQEVVDRFLALIQQQETQTPEPQFAQTYVKLGEQYQKLGHGDYARDIWRRGAGLFPDDQALQKLATQP